MSVTSIYNACYRHRNPYMHLIYAPIDRLLDHLEHNHGIAAIHRVREACCLALVAISALTAGNAFLLITIR